MKNCVVIGGGIIGLCSAYYLQKEGHQVTIIDQSNMDSGASYVNAGYLSPSHIIPLAAPGVMKKGLKWMFNTSSPLYIRPRLEPDFLKWVWAFNKSCNPKHVQRSIPAIKDIALLSQELCDEIRENENFTFHYEKKGLMMLCQSEKALEEEMKVAQLARNEGLEVENLTAVEVRKLESKAVLSIRGATYYKCDYHTTPHEFMEEMKSYLLNEGVQFYTNEKVEDIEYRDQKMRAIISTKRQLRADEFVLAAGSWSSMLTQKIGLKLLVQAGKGYRMNSFRKTHITIPAILAEAKVAVTPMNGFTRFAGTMEIAGINQRIRKARVEAIANAVSKYYPEISISTEEKADAASGLRPVSPDGLPYIGKSNKCQNLTIATGHAMMGWSMAAATGKLVSQIISEKKTAIKLSSFHPDRKF